MTNYHYSLKLHNGDAHSGTLAALDIHDAIREACLIHAIEAVQLRAVLVAEVTDITG